MPKIEIKKTKTPLKIRKNENYNLNLINEKFLEPKICKRYLDTFTNLDNIEDIKINFFLKNKKMKKNNYKVKNFKKLKNKMLNKTHDFQKSNNNFISNNGSTNKTIIKNDNSQNKIGVLKEIEKKSILIQKMLRGTLIRKKYEKKLTNMKNKSNLNDENNKIGVLKDIEKKSINSKNVKRKFNQEKI